MDLAIPLTYEAESPSELINMLAVNDLVQLNSIRNSNGGILDLLLSNTPDGFAHRAQPLVKIDAHHPPFTIHFSASDLKFIKTNKSTIIGKLSGDRKKRRIRELRHDSR